MPFLRDCTKFLKSAQPVDRKRPAQCADLLGLCGLRHDAKQHAIDFIDHGPEFAVIANLRITERRHKVDQGAILMFQPAPQHKRNHTCRLRDQRWFASVDGKFCTQPINFHIDRTRVCLVCVSSGCRFFLCNLLGVTVWPCWNCPYSQMSLHSVSSNELRSI